ncbi:MAG: ATP-dependent DNA helicase RecG [Elusimicrobia bacterium]|nr:ATP-dependent DNA helicase RecG [Elusimicrobiota bacterium]
MNLTTDIKYIKGIGPKRALALSKLSINNVEDLITFFPRAYQDRTTRTKISNILFSQHYCIFGKIINTYTKKLSMNLSVFSAEIDDGSGTITANFFRKVNPYSKFDIFATIKKSFKINSFVYLYGICELKFNQKQISVEDYEVVENENIIPEQFNKLIPVYDLTAGITQKTISSALKLVLNDMANIYPDIISTNIKYKTNLPTISQALKTIHFPKTLKEAELARQAFALQEFLVLQIILTKAKQKNTAKQKTSKYTVTRKFLTPFKNKLKFEFTKAQKKAINEIFNDMMSEKSMNRMLMGDVGSGKTVVALSAILLAVENGYQTAIIAPTELLAEQHYLTFKNMLEGLNINIELVTSSSLKSKKKQKEILSAIKDGTTNIIVGTHSIIQERVEFKNLSLVIIDEQHRFGVLQKASALAKGNNPDVLMMTATPIPRGLAMTIYGEMSVSVLDELPPNRTPIQTYCLSENIAYDYALEEIEKGNQIYIVYPLVDESDKIELKSAKQEAEKLSQTVFKNNRVALLHGKMKPKEKNDVMLKFKNKEFDVLISTTVIEVGIDVPNATMIIIQHADRYGLATLHQLRGRVGRGHKKSYCILVSNAKGQTAKQRLQIMTTTTDGFKIASEDLKMRGPGEFTGTLQHGFPEFKAGDIIKDVKLIEYAKQMAVDIITNDSEFTAPENANINTLINTKYLQLSKIIQVG